MHVEYLEGTVHVRVRRCASCTYCTTRLLSVLEDVLNDVVSVLVLQQLVRVLVQLLQDGRRLLRLAVLQDALDHPAAVRVRRERVHLK